MLVKVVNALLLAVDCGHVSVLLLVNYRSEFDISPDSLMTWLGKMVRQTWYRSYLTEKNVTSFLELMKIIQSCKDLLDMSPLSIVFISLFIGLMSSVVHQLSPD